MPRGSTRVVSKVLPLSGSTGVGWPTNFADFMEEHWRLIDKPIAVLKEFGVDEAVRRMDSTEDCVKVAAAMAKILREMTEMPEGPLPERESSLTKRPNQKKTVQMSRLQETILRFVTKRGSIALLMSLALTMKMMKNQTNR